MHIGQIHFCINFFYSIVLQIYYGAFLPSSYSVSHPNEGSNTTAKNVSLSDAKFGPTDDSTNVTENEVISNVTSGENNLVKESALKSEILSVYKVRCELFVFSLDYFRGQFLNLSKTKKQIFSKIIFQPALSFGWSC